MKHTPERWDVLHVRDVLARHDATKGALTLLDAECVRRGLDPLKEMPSDLVDLAATLAWLILRDDGHSARRAEATLTHAHVTAHHVFSRRLQRATTVTVRDPHQDS